MTGTLLRVAVDAIAARPGGGMSYLREQLPALERQGIQLVVFANRAAAKELAVLLQTADVIEWRASTWETGLVRRNLSLDLEARRRGARVLYCPGSTSPLCGRLPRVLLFQNPHLFTPYAPRATRLTLLRLHAWWSALTAAEIVHISRAMATDFDATSALRCQSTIIYSGAGLSLSNRPTEALHPDSAQPHSDEAYILAVSNLYGYKRMDAVLEAFGSDPKLFKRYRLVIAGDEKESGILATLRSRAYELGISDRVDLLGFVTGARLADLYRRACLYVSVSEREAFPLTPAEALIAGTPVLLSNIPVFVELYGPWMHVAHSRRAAPLAQAIRSALAKEWDPAVPDAVRDRFSWESNARELASLLRQTAAREMPSHRLRRAKVDPLRLPVLAQTIWGRREGVQA